VLRAATDSCRIEIVKALLIQEGLSGVEKKTCIPPVLALLRLTGERPARKADMLARLTPERGQSATKRAPNLALFAAAFCTPLLDLFLARAGPCVCRSSP
jgi:hypothetical protein